MHSFSAWFWHTSSEIDIGELWKKKSIINMFEIPIEQTFSRWERRRYDEIHKKKPSKIDGIEQRKVRGRTVLRNENEIKQKKWNHLSAWFVEIINLLDYYFGCKVCITDWLNNYCINKSSEVIIDLYVQRFCSVFIFFFSFKFILKLLRLFQ